MSRIVLNFSLCRDCRNCQAKCSYPYHSGNIGIEAVREKIMSGLYCRNCEARVCEKVCPSQALEAEGAGGIKRNLFRCVSCYSCSLACPFGVLDQAYLVYQSNICDLCPEREPECVKSCPKQAIQLMEDSSGLEGAKRISEQILAIGAGWDPEDK